jgi:hypothetical protein
LLSAAARCCVVCVTKAFTRLALAFAVLGLAITTLAAPANATGHRAHWHWFSSPSGNIGCVVNKHFARCDIGERSWQAPPKPRSCHLDWGNGMDLQRKSHWSCAGDTVLGSKKTLEYGDFVRYGNLRCTSKTTGMVCLNVSTGHGFKLARASYRLF